MVPPGPKSVRTRAQRRVCRRLEPSKLVELVQGYSDGVPETNGLAGFRSIRVPFRSTPAGTAYPAGPLGLAQTRSRSNVPILLVSLRPNSPITSVSLLRPSPSHYGKLESPCDLGGGWTRLQPAPSRELPIVPSTLGLPKLESLEYELTALVRDPRIAAA
jgi:hypothetical protein